MSDIPKMEVISNGASVIRDMTPEEIALHCAPEPMKSYVELRAAEYPPMAEYLDGVVKGDAEQVQAYIDACLAVKAKYPKPI